METPVPARTVLAGNAWNTANGVLVALVPDDATDVTATSDDGLARKMPVVGNMLIADGARSYGYRTADKNYDIPVSSGR